MVGFDFIMILLILYVHRVTPHPLCRMADKGYVPSDAALRADAEGLVASL